MTLVLIMVARIIAEAVSISIAATHSAVIFQAGLLSHNDITYLFSSAYFHYIDKIYMMNSDGQITKITFLNNFII